ncbi:uncharacterized protein LOC143049946 isoform X1 [Mytilus galloprovincialis]|uniref:uncharacterized protein LOC143049946 isoform X1 n=1 Tax=Mytilus galloprovincialis TaxID=29158 RepID=UPI003F7CAF29
MDRGRNNFFEALHEVEEGEEPEDSDDERKRQGSSDESDSSGDEEPDPAAKRREPNKFDNLCDGVLNAMALVHTAMTELLEMKDEMIKHALPPTVLVKLATITGKVFRSVSDANMPVNELVRLVRVYSTPWEEKSAALKKLHEDYESNQRQLNIAIKRLKLVETQSKQIAREKKIMNWEKLFSKIMSNKGHGRRWKFLIESIKQKAKLGLEHVQEYTRALEESSDEEEEEEDDEMPLSLKPQDEADDSDKLSDLEEEGEDVSSDKGSVDSDQKLGLEEYESDAEREQSPKKVRFAEEQEEKPPEPPKPEMKEVAVWTHEPEYDHYLYVRVHTPKSIKQEELKCMITFQNKILKTGRLDVVEEVKPETPKEEEVKPKKGLIGSRAKPAEDKKAVLEKKMQEMRGDVPSIHEDVVFDLPGDRLPTPNKEEPDQNVKVSIHSGQMEEMIAMATINLEDIQVLELPTIVLPEPHGDDDAPHTPRDSDDVESISEDIDLMLGDKSVDKVKDEKKEADPAAKFASFDFPVYPLNQTRGKHEPCGYIPITFYYAKKFKPRTFVRQAGTMPFNDLVFEVAGIDLTSWKRDDMFREFADEALSAISFSPEVKTPEPPKPKTPEPPKPKTPEPPKPQTPELQKPPSPAKSPVRSPVKEEMVKKSDVESLVYKHNAELELVQQEYEKRLQSLMENMHEMQQTQEQQKQQLEQQQKQQKQRPPLVHQRPVSSESRKSAGSTGRKSANQNQAPPPKSPARLSPRVPSPDKKHEVPVHEQPPPVQKLVEISDSVDRIPQQSQSHPPPPHRPRKTLKPIASRQNVTSAPASQQPDKHIATGVPEDFFERLQFFEDESKQHKKEMMEKTTKAIRDDLEKKLAGQHKLSKHEEEIYDALKDVTLPALFMPFKTGTIFNPRAHQYFHATGSTDLRLSQPPSMFQLPPLPTKSRMSVVNLFELSRNFSSRGQAWLMEKYIQQQEPVANVHGVVPHTPVPTITNASRGQSAPQQDKVSSGMNSNQSQINSVRDPRELDAEMEMEME